MQFHKLTLYKNLPINLAIITNITRLRAGVCMKYLVTSNTLPARTHTLLCRRERAMPSNMVVVPYWATRRLTYGRMAMNLLI